MAAERGDIDALVGRGRIVAARRQSRSSAVPRQAAIAQFHRTRGAESPLEFSPAGAAGRQYTLQNETNSSHFD
ncbi:MULTISPECIES: hypothetical protein [Lysobacter]|uniref:hypothetical protein n=1 Tax=Lysobacter TaxID=68 RepID=UPI001F21729E|nr:MULTISPECIES: hypothetical protein [Lysobacter]UJB20270.1 hypothetical protein L1A79_04080 [Lysobacter capsici]UJQ30616.1 hypothetical protein L2D09_10780 [Lysobacter gummosus]